MKATASQHRTHGEAVKDLPVGKFVTLEARLARGGSLQARRLTTGAVQLYWRYSYQGSTNREPIGPYDASSPPKKLEPGPKGYSVAAAIERCRQLGEIHSDRMNTGGFKQAVKEERATFQASQTAEASRADRTLKKLLLAYVDYLKLKGRRSHKDAQNIFENHIFDPWPEISSLPANEVGPDEILDILRRVVENNKGRTANKLRSYVRAAYQCAIDVRAAPSIPVAFKAFNVNLNVVAATRRDPSFDKADKRPLAVHDMQRYWGILSAAPWSTAISMLKLHVATGGQRIEQLVRLKKSDIGSDRITLYDGKGRPGQPPRPFVVPLLPLAKTELQRLAAQGEYLFSTTKGEKPVSAATLTKWAKDLVGDQISDFQLKRIRSGVETLLAANKINRDVRGHLQSHGLTGIQVKHYDGHDYFEEKYAALNLLAKSLTKNPPNNLQPHSISSASAPQTKGRGVKRRAEAPSS